MKRATHGSILLDELLEEILSRLSVKDLLRLRCVSKSWCALIDDSRFIRKQHQSQYALLKADGDVPLILIRDGLRFTYDDDGPRLSQFFLLSKRRGDDVLLEFTTDLHRDGQHVFADYPDAFCTLHCWGVVNGVLCLGWGDKTKSMGLWNPATREFKVIAPCDKFQGSRIDGRQIIGFGFDPVSNDFKILGHRFISTEGEGSKMLYAMYSLSTNSWKSLKEPSTMVLAYPPSVDVYLNGVYYWIGCEIEREIPNNMIRFVILSFDFRSEVFKVSDLPKDAIPNLYEYPPLDCRIGWYMDSPAALIFSNDYEAAICCVDVWVMTKFDDHDHGIPLSWQHLCTIGQIPAFNGLEAYSFRMDGDLLLVIPNTNGDDNEEGIFYNPLTRTFKKVTTTFGFSSRYVETLFPLSNKLV